MPEKKESPAGQKDVQEITFKCKFCGEQKPLREMVLMKQYFPQMAACKECSRATRTETPTQPAENIN